ncbi:MAG: hypothetical protein KF855_01590 [Acidobacteria bacterium]|nr:hypothetical protein [Acidobacteriota bacterium]
MERIFQAVAVVLAGTAVYLLWNGRPDSAFIAAVLGCIAFFLGIRVQVKRRNTLREAAAVAEADNELPDRE